MGDGDEALFWKETYKGFKVLDKEFNFSYAIDTIGSKLGYKVKEIVEFFPGRKGWHCKKFGDFDIPIRENNIPRELLKARKVSFRLGKDK